MRQIEAKVAYRIPLVGGFTDFPQFYRRFGGHTISCAIDKFVTVAIAPNRSGGINISTKSDLSWGMGLGSSGAFHSALVSALAKSKNRNLTATAIAELAYQIEAGIDAHATGKQDSYASMFRGISSIVYRPNDTVEITQVPVKKQFQQQLDRRLLLFDIGVRRRASTSIKDIFSKNNEALLREIGKIPNKLLREWKGENIDFLASAIDSNERFRAQLSETCRSRRSDKYLNIAKDSGAAARLIGAGIGCLLCYCHENQQRELRKRLQLVEIPFSILW